MVTTAFIALLLAITAGRLCTSRGIALLSVEQKALVVDVSSKNNIWLPVSLAILVVVPWWLVASHSPHPYFIGFVATHLFSLFLLSLGAAGINLHRLSRLGLPRAYVCSVAFSPSLVHFGLLLLMCAFIYY